MLINTWKEGMPMIIRRYDPFDVDVKKIDAKLSQGVLELTIPKIEPVKPRRIEIKSG